MKTKKTLRPVVRRIVKTLQEQYQPEKIILFGSYASGKARPDSDIDLLIIKSTHKPFFDRLLEVRGIVSDSRRGFPFDPIVLTPTELKKRLSRGDQFFEEILTAGHVLYARK